MFYMLVYKLWQSHRDRIFSQFTNINESIVKGYWPNKKKKERKEGY